MKKFTKKYSFFKQIGFRKFLEKDEKIIRAFRKPFIFTFGRICYRGAIWSSLAFLVYFFLPASFYFLFLIILGFGIYKVSAAFFFWFFNSILMTNENIIIVSWPSLYHRKFTRIDYWHLDEISVEKKGVHSFFLNFGSLHFHKNNSGVPLIVHNIKRPKRTANIIEEFREQIVDHKNFTEESALKNLLSQLVKNHVKVHGQPEREKNNFFDKKEENIKNSKSQSFIFWKRKKQEKNILIEKEFDDSGGVMIDL